jgi:hypothetical protein
MLFAVRGSRFCPRTGFLLAFELVDEKGESVEAEA